jgi:preprotein translocase subunit SecD
MNQYPLWKYLLILAVLLAGLIYTLPNFYGESPAVQVSPLRANLKADAGLLERVGNILKTANLAPELIERGLPIPTCN